VWATPSGDIAYVVALETSTYTFCLLRIAKEQLVTRGCDPAGALKQVWLGIIYPGFILESRAR